VSPSALDERLWSAIGEPTRVRVIDVLLEGDANVSQVASRLPVSRQAVAKHLAVLERSGLVESARVGRQLRYHLASERLAAARSALAERAAAWDARLVRIKTLAEAGGRQSEAGDRRRT
jgi:DNA-binding transcriptional ArsR family regulator